MALNSNYVIFLHEQLMEKKSVQNIRCRTHQDLRICFETIFGVVYIELNNPEIASSVTSFVTILAHL